MRPDGPPLLGRSVLLGAIEEALRTGGGVALHGPGGIGKSVLLEAVAAGAAARGDLVIRLRPAQSERLLPYAGVSDLVHRLPAAAPDALPPAQRAVLAAWRQGLPPRAAIPEPARRRVLPLLLAHHARARPILLVLDDVQWLDRES